MNAAENSDIQSPFPVCKVLVIDRHTAEIVKPLAVNLKQIPQGIIGQSKNEVHPVAIRQLVKLGGNPQVRGLWASGPVTGIGYVFYTLSIGIIIVDNIVK